MPFGLPNLEQKLSRFIEGDTGITAIREIEWDRKYLWLIEFIDADLPEPFNTMFPASAFSRLGASIESDSFRFGQTELSLPVRGGSAENISITFYDDINRTLYRWMSDWMNLDILNDGQFVSGLKDRHSTIRPDAFGNIRAVQPVRTVKISLLDGYRKEFKAQLFDIYPTGDLEYAGAQVSEAQEYTITFNVVGKSAGKAHDYNAGLDILRDIAGRII